MKLVFISNYINHHQIPFCEEMKTILGSDFVFIETIPISSDRLKMGWELESKDYVIRAHVSNESRLYAKKVVDEADAVLFGSADEWFIRDRLKNNKMIMRYSERIYKSGLARKNFIKSFYRAWKYHGRYQGKDNYLLCASAYAPCDFAVFHNYIDKTYRWGYFTEVLEYDITKLMAQKRDNTVPVILWAARFIEWKHPEIPILLAHKLKNDGYSFKIQLIGNGDLEHNIRLLIDEYGVSDCVELLGAMKPQQVRKYMEEANIFLCTSDYNEGWGAVINESMNSGCAVVASHAIGAVPFLIKNEVNGLIYENGNLDSIYEKVVSLIKNPSRIEKLGIEAYKTIIDEWNPKIAAVRLIQLINQLIDERSCDLFNSGPCSKAPNISQKKMYSYCVLKGNDS